MIYNGKKLGFGLMRLPQKDGEIDVEQVKTMVDLFLEAGCTYFDTAFVYPGSEEAIRQALVERHPRESFTLASKLAAWSNCRTRDEALAQFDTSLKRSGAGYFDYYLLHNLGKQRTRSFEEFDIWRFVREMKEQGKIRHFGFSFHSSAEELDEILTAHPEAEFVQLQINYADWTSPDIQSQKVYETARKHNKPVVIMEPVKGGLLAQPPASVEAVLKAADPDASCASWAIRYAAGLEGVMTVLSGMSSVEQMRDNLSYMKDFRPLDTKEQAVIEQARAELEKVPLIPCTACDYCAKVCPQNIGISGTFAAMNLLTAFRNKTFAINKMNFSVIEAGKKTADKCIKCGQCEAVCPQQIPIREHLAEAAEIFYK